ncbi:MAG: hypothetical protein U1F68_17515 [Gammaproteobacteria bacterium]
MKTLTATLVVVSIGLIGCAPPVPSPIVYDKSNQYKMLAAHHWDVFAKDVATRLATALKDGNPSKSVVLYVEKPSTGTVFNNTFYELLTTQLMQQGFGITRSAEATPLHVTYTTTFAGKVDVDVQNAPVDVVAADDDVVVTVSVTNGDRFVTRISEVFYIDYFARQEYIASTGSRAPNHLRLIEVVGQ